MSVIYLKVFPISFFFSLTGDLQLGKVIGWDLLGLRTWFGGCLITAVLHNLKISHSKVSKYQSNTINELGTISTAHD